MGDWAGFILTGGQSSRMGRDKASLPLDSAPLAVQTAELLSTVCRQVKLVGSHRCFGLPNIDDEAPGSGPLGAIVSALAQSAFEWNLIVACDMPGLTRGFLENLQARAEAGSAGCVVPRGPSGRLDPLCAAYRRSCEIPLRSAFDSGLRSLREALGSLTCDIWDIPDVAPLRNVNTPEEWYAFLRERSIR
jgi:molybdopterin-guanine dinucleotide biosynthesis protein A